MVISGFGSVGSGIADGLAAEGAHIVVSDVEQSRTDIALAKGYGWVEPDQAPSAPADIFVPAAVGGVLSEATVPLLNASLVVGPANNQLTEESVVDTLAKRGVVWIPDYVASAGGILYALSQESENYSHEAAHKRVEGIGDTVSHVLELARSSGVTPLRAAQKIAEARLVSATGQARGA
ncbi:hypothetical protein [Streptomyces spiralis]|uniref:hypothetical protein n=1 Tax=Streptomyces spiralis TaxID=66376 RepID=UPI0036B4EFBC